MVKNWSATCFVALALLGCLSDGQKPPDRQRPNNPKFQEPQRPKFQEPQVTDTRCHIDDQMKVACGTTGITGERCVELRCCFDGQECYYGRGVTVQCTKDAQFIVVAARASTLPNMDLDSISMLGGNEAPCFAVGNNAMFAVYQFPVTGCGSIITEEQGTIVYENRMASTYEVQVGPRSSITRDSQYELAFQCRYLGVSVETVVLEPVVVAHPFDFKTPGPLRVELRLANGECLTKGCDRDEEAYTSYYSDGEYPITKVLRETVYVEVNVPDRTDPNILLSLGRCWVTNTPNPHSLPQWDILVDGCPCHNDPYRSAVIPVGPSSGLAYPTHYKRFKFQMFTFVCDDQTPMHESVFIHCSTAVCSPNQGCERQCNTASDPKRGLGFAPVPAPAYHPAPLRPRDPAQTPDKFRGRRDEAAQRKTSGGTVVSSRQITMEGVSCRI